MKENNMLASDVNIEYYAELLKGYTGAEIEGVTKAALNYAIGRETIIENNEVKQNNKMNILVTNKDFINASNDIVPMFGSSKNIIHEIKMINNFNIWC